MSPPPPPPTPCRCELLLKWGCVQQQKGAGRENEAATRETFPNQPAANGAWTGGKSLTLGGIPRGSVTTTPAGRARLTTQDNGGLKKVCLLTLATNPRNPDQSWRPWCYIRRGRRIVREFCAVPMCKPDWKWKKVSVSCGAVFWSLLLLHDRPQNNRTPTTCCTGYR